MQALAINKRSLLTTTAGLGRSAEQMSPIVLVSAYSLEYFPPELVCGRSLLGNVRSGLNWPNRLLRDFLLHKSNVLCLDDAEMRMPDICILYSL